MNTQNQSSFIPKKPIQGSSRPRPVKRVYLISIVSSVLFVSTMLAAGGIFVYTMVLEQELVAEQQRLNDQRESFNQGSLEQVLEFEARLEAANQILNQQVYLPALLTALEETALQSTTYTGFAYEKTDLSGITVSLSTENPTFNGVLFQRDVLASNEVLQGARVTDVSFSLNESEEAPGGVIAFTIEHSPSSRLLQNNQPAAAFEATNNGQSESFGEDAPLSEQGEALIDDTATDTIINSELNI